MLKIEAVPESRLRLRSRGAEGYGAYAVIDSSGTWNALVSDVAVARMTYMRTMTVKDGLTNARKDKVNADLFSFINP